MGQESVHRARIPFVLDQTAIVVIVLAIEVALSKLTETQILLIEQIALLHKKYSNPLTSIRPPRPFLVATNHADLQTIPILQELRTKPRRGK